MGTEKRIRATVPGIEYTIALGLKARGCEFEGDTIIFPPGTTKSWEKGLGIMTTVSEFFTITLPDGYTLREQRDSIREISLLSVPLDGRMEGNRIQAKLDTIRDLARTGPISGELPDGRVIVIEQNQECWMVRVYQGAILLLSWEGKTIDAALCIGAYRHQVKLFDVKTWTPIA